MHVPFGVIKECAHASSVAGGGIYDRDKSGTELFDCGAFCFTITRAPAEVFCTVVSFVHFVCADGGGKVEIHEVVRMKISFIRGFLRVCGGRGMFTFHDVSEQRFWKGNGEKQSNSV